MKDLVNFQEHELLEGDIRHLPVGLSLRRGSVRKVLRCVSSDVLEYNSVTDLKALSDSPRCILCVLSFPSRPC